MNVYQNVSGELEEQPMKQKKRYIIALNKELRYYLSIVWCEAAEQVLEHGFTWTTKRDEFMRFRTKKDAKDKIQQLKRYGTGKDAVIVEEIIYEED